MGDLMGSEMCGQRLEKQKWLCKHHFALLVKGSLISASGFTTTTLKNRSSLAYVNIYLLAVCTSIVLSMLQMIGGLLLQMEIHGESTVWKLVMISQTRLLINLMPSVPGWHLRGVLWLPSQSVKFRHLLNTGFFSGSKH